MSRYREPFTLFKRGKYWYFRTYDLNGKRTVAKTTGKTSKTEAKDYCNQLFKTNTLGFSRLTFFDFAAGFFDKDSVYIKDRMRPLAEGTIARYSIVLNKYLLPDFGKFLIQDISRTIVKEYRQKLLESLSPNTVNSIISTFYTIMQVAYLDGKVPRNPVEGIGLLNRTSQKDSITIEELKKLYDRCPLYFRYMLLLMALTGMRFSEAYGIRQNDFIKYGDYYYIRLNKQQRGNGNYTQLKTHNERLVPVHKELYSLYQEHTYTHTYTHILLNNLVKALDQNRELSVHSLRHFFISQTKTDGVNPILSELVAGHSIKGIEKTYTHIHEIDLQPVVEWQEKILKMLKK